jgi:hypothetical protein
LKLPKSLSTRVWSYDLIHKGTQPKIVAARI